MKKELIQHITEVLVSLGVGDVGAVVLERPQDIMHGDWATNVALVYAKQVKKIPAVFAREIVEALTERKISNVKSISVAGPGFINIMLEPAYYNARLSSLLAEGDSFGNTDVYQGEKVMVEYTDPNPFKVFHIGHLMNNAIGESLACVTEAGGAEVVRANYQGDVGLHVAKAIWGMRQNKLAFPHDTDDLHTKMRFVSDAYVLGASRYEEDELAKKEIDVINREVYSRENDDTNVYYDKGRSWSLEHFEEVYVLLGTTFDRYYFESEVAEKGVSIVRANMGSVFEESNGAIIYRGEKHGLHTRVFINSQGLPTYDAKDIGLTWTKEEGYDLTRSIVVTADEQREYYKVLMAAIGDIDPKVAKKMVHITHGMMQGPDGSKLSSRKGTALTGVSLIEEVKALVYEKLKEREMSEEEKKRVAEYVAVGAVKYSILRAKTSSDIAFDFDRSISFEGDSGPYLQYTAVRARSLLQKAHSLYPGVYVPEYRESERTLHLLLDRYEEVVTRSQREFQPHYIATFAIELASAFNAFYSNNKILHTPEASSRLALVFVTERTLTHALKLLGIRVPDKM